MQNRLIHSLDHRDALPASPQSWDTDRHPSSRLGWLLMLVLGPFAGVAFRLAELQFSARDGFTTIDTYQVETDESLASSNGRIVASDGTVLAEDVQHFEVQIHYRWLEEPADPGWLRYQALSRLPESLRRDRRRVKQEEQRVLALRRAMWHRLATRVGLTAAELAQRRHAIQSRVERIVGSVEKRRTQSYQNNDLAIKPARPDSRSRLAAWWPYVYQTVVAALTTPPERTKCEPIVVQEELSYHKIADGIPVEAVAVIESHAELFPGLRCQVSYERIYPEGSLAAHVVGVRRGLAASREAGKQPDAARNDPFAYRPGDLVGQTGVERSYERFLRGVRGVRHVVRDRRGEVMGSEVVREPQAGRDVQLTLNLPLQRCAEQLLDAVIASPDPDTQTISGPSGGCIAVLDVHTGALVAAASAPRFDLNLLVHPDPRDWQRVSSDPRHPFFSRLTQLQLPPGSTFKPLTAIAALESGQLDPERAIHCAGYLDRPDRYRCLIYRRYGVGHGEVRLQDALCRSCNVYFFTAARQMGPEPLVQWAERFGFGQNTGVDLPGERPGHLPRPTHSNQGHVEPEAGLAQTLVSPFDWDQTQQGTVQQVSARSSERWYNGDTLGLAIGQSRLTVTPLQIVRLMAAISNGGLLVTPHVVERVGAGAGRHNSNGLSPSADTVAIRGLSAATLRRIRDGLESVVANRRGTGHRTVWLKSVSIAGKTGTAETGGSAADHAWFAGYVPAQKTRYAFVVVLEHGGSGGAKAGPLARQIVQKMLQVGLIRGNDSTSAQK